MSNPKGHSNVRVEEITKNKRTDAAMIPLEGGATVDTVRPLPTLALRRKEWKEIGARMNWFASDPSDSGGALWVEFHDRTGRIEVEDLAFEGIHAAKYQCEQMLEELETAQEKLDAAAAER